MPIFKHNLRASKTAADIRFSGNLLIITLNDGRFLSVPLEDIEWLHWLLAATPAQRAQWSLEPGGFAVYWDALDDGFEIEHLLAMSEVQIQTHAADRQSIPA